MSYALQNYASFVVALLLGTFLLAAPLGASAQEVSYVQHDYMKVPPGQEQAYVDLEQDLWKPIHRQRVEDGTIAGWNLYEVVYPAGANRKHDYVTVTFFEEWGNLPNSITTDHVEQAHPDKDPQQILQQTVETRSLDHSEVVEVIESVTSDAQESENGNYVLVDFMKVPEGGGSAYVQMEQDLFKPVHRKRIEQTSQQAWFLVGRQFTGAGDPYQYMTIHPVANWSDVEPAAFSQALLSAFEEVHPDAVASEVGDRVTKTRTIVRREVWRLVDSVESSE